MGNDKKRDIEILSEYIDKERKDLLTIESAIQSAEETLRVLSRRYTEIKERLITLEEILDATNSMY